MAEQTVKTDTKNNNRSKNKIVAAVAVSFALIAVLIIFLCTKNILFFSLSQRFVLNRDFETAENLAEMCSSDEAKLLDSYIDLRQDINYYYALMLSDLNIEKLREWQNTAAAVKKGCSIFNKEVRAEAEKLSDTLDNICNAVDKYGTLKPEIMELFDIFNEINRLYTKDESGLNPKFTIAQELAAIERWEEIALKLDEFLKNTENGEKMYLFTYFIKEAQGEAADLRTSMNNFTAQGYDVNAPIRVTGSTVRTFQSVRNSNGASVNLQQSDVYEEYMYQGMFSALIESLGEFYTK